jgi:dimethylhistidine N-methyltransferase
MTIVRHFNNHFMSLLTPPELTATSAQFTESSESLIVLDRTHSELNNAGEDVIEGLGRSPKTLPAQYFYDDRGSELFEQICQLPEYYPTRTEAWILQHYAAEIAQVTNSHELIELGSGSSTKTRLLLDAYRDTLGRCHYLPVDVSGGILGSTVDHLQVQYPEFLIQGLWGTYDQALAYLGTTQAPSRTIFFLGSSIGNFNATECDRFLHQVAAALTPNDWFLLGIDLQKEASLLEAAYNDRQGVTAAFNVNMLSHLNWRFQGDFDERLFVHRACYNALDGQIEMYLDCQQACDVTLKTLDLQVSFAAGEAMLTEISRKFQLTQLEQQLNRQGLKTVQCWTDPQSWFGLVLCHTQ